MIDQYIINIEKRFNKKNIQSAFQLINEIKQKYPKSNSVKVLFNKNRLKYEKKMRTSSNELEMLLKDKNLNNAKIKIDKFLKIEPDNAYLNSFLCNYYGNW